ncbi:uncharacterized protein LOC115240071 [Formica exsecta]|uniref:uncharacterized protein LOC115240071 n=1 Tax=Formica exsecta TaxID=72781 RepID=UPI001144265C|nr:uncharacterized protein LOC115240071 [Formica exsecta]
MNETCHLTNEDFQHLAEAIVKDFPTEAVPTYYIPAIPKKLSRVGKSVISRGKLVDKYRNKLRLLKRIRVGNPLAEITNFQTTESSLHDPNTETIREAEGWLKSHSTPWEIVVGKWKLTAEYRHKIIKSDRGLKVCEIFERWPILKHPNAHKLIEEDYAFLNLPALKLTLESWKTFFEKILIIRPPKKDDDNAQSLLELLEHEKLNDNSKIVLQLRLLPHLLPPKGRIHLKKKQWKPSITESKDSLVIQTTVSIMIIKIRGVSHSSKICTCIANYREIQVIPSNSI